MLILPDKRVAQRSFIKCLSGVAQSGYKSAAPGGPAGSSLMTFAVVLTWRLGSIAGNNYLFNRYNGGVNGWYMLSTSDGTIQSAACNSTPAIVAAGNVFLVSGQPTVVIFRYNNGTSQAWANGTAGTATTLGAGYTPGNVATMIGTLLASSAFNAQYQQIHDCFMIDGYDVVASYNTSFGTGAVGLTAQWQEDLQQGRYLTCPRNGGVLGASDWYWSSRDVVAGNGATNASWVDRGTNAVSLTKNGTPHGGAVPMRF